MSAIWMVRFRACDSLWAAEHEHVQDYAPIWDQIPWNKRLTQRITTESGSARSQYETLKNWERTKTQPVREVQLLRGETQPTDWQEVTP